MTALAQPLPEAGFLGVEASLSGRRWTARPADDRLALALAQRLDLPEILGRVLAARGVGLDEAADFLAPSLRASLPDPSRFKDMDRAVAFYRDVLGFHVTNRGPVPGGSEIAFLSQDPSAHHQIAMVGGLEPPDAALPGRDGGGVV